MKRKTADIAVVALIVLLTLPSSACSLTFTIVGTSEVSAGAGMALERGIAILICSTIGWIICGLGIWGAIRLARAARREESTQGQP
jgi:hypothetical protein